MREKSWVQYFMPYSEVGYVKNATKDALLNLEIKEGKARLVLYTTGANSGVRIIVKAIKGTVLLDKTTNFAIRTVYYDFCGRRTKRRGGMCRGS